MFIILLMIFVYVLFLIFLPTLLSFWIPCLTGIENQSFAYDACTVELPLYYYTALSLAVMGLLLIAFFFINRKRSLLQVFIFGCVLSLMAIIGFYAYIPQLERKLTSVSRYIPELDSRRL